MKKQKLDLTKLQDFKNEQLKCSSMDWTTQSVCKYMKFLVGCGCHCGRFEHLIASSDYIS